MRKLLLVALLVTVIVTLASVAVSPTKTEAAIPKSCELAGYGPQWLMACIVDLALELWIDPLDMLQGQPPSES